MTDPLSRAPGIWRAGMLAGCGNRGFVRITDPVLFAENFLVPSGHGWTAPTICMGDPTGATTGCLAAFCRELYGDPYMYAICTPGEEPGDPAVWQVRVPLRHGSRRLVDSPTEPSAWRAAILAHPSLLETP